MILLCFIWIVHPEPSLARVRGLYEQCVISQDSCRTLLQLLNDFDERNDPLLAGYRAGATMVMAKYAFSPFTKWNYFRQGRDLLERSVAVDRMDIELIFIRYSIQMNCPWVLHYRRWVIQDRKFIDSNVDRVSDPVLKSKIRNYLEKTRA